MRDKFLNKVAAYCFASLIVGAALGGLIVHSFWPDNSPTGLVQTVRASEPTPSAEAIKETTSPAELMPKAPKKYNFSFYESRHYLAIESIGAPEYICASADLEVIKGIAVVLAEKHVKPASIEEGARYPIGGGVEAYRTSSYIKATCNGNEWTLADCADQEWANTILYSLYLHALEPASS